MLGDYGQNNFVGKISVAIDLFVLCFLNIVHVLANQYFDQWKYISTSTLYFLVVKYIDKNPENDEKGWRS